MSDIILPTAGEHMPQEYNVSRDLECFMDSAEVRPHLCQQSGTCTAVVLYVMQFSLQQKSFQPSWPHYEIYQITNVKKTASLASVCEVQ